MRHRPRIALDDRGSKILSPHHTSRYQGIGTYSRGLIQSLRGCASHEWVPWGQAADLHHLLEFILPPGLPPEKTVATVYDLIPLIYPQMYMRWRNPRSRMKLARYYRFLKKAKALIAISKQTASDLTRLLDIAPKKIHVIYPGLHLPLAQPKNGPLLEAPYFLCVGAPAPHKNWVCAIQALALFLKQRAGHRMVFTGRWNPRQSQALLKQVPDLPSHAVVFTGYLPEQELVNLYRHAAALVHPSLYEGFGLPVLEAFSCGLPVLASHTPALAEVAGSSALFFDPLKPEQLAECMRQIIRQPSLAKQLCESGRVRSKDFRWSRCVEETLAVYGGNL